MWYYFLCICLFLYFGFHCVSIVVGRPSRCASPLAIIWYLLLFDDNDKLSFVAVLFCCSSCVTGCSSWRASHTIYLLKSCLRFIYNFKDSVSNYISVDSTCVTKQFITVVCAAAAFWASGFNPNLFA